jgi:hypothetical protein
MSNSMLRSLASAAALREFIFEVAKKSLRESFSFWRKAAALTVFLISLVATSLGHRQRRLASNQTFAS